MNLRRRFPRCLPLVLLVLGASASAAEGPLTTPAIAGVVRAGTVVELVQEGFESVEGPLPQPDGGLLFTNNRVNRIQRLAPDGTVSVWFEGQGGPNALTVTPAGEIAATLTERHAIGIVAPGAAPRVLVDAIDGVAFGRPNDVVANRRGDLYFSDLVAAPVGGAASVPSSVYRLDAKGALTRIAADIARPNGVALSPDERTLYVANTAGESLLAFPLDREGRAGTHRDFAKLTVPPAPSAMAQPAPAAGSGADGIAVDEKGRVYVATTVGVQVFSAKGAPLGTIALPKAPQNLAFSGPGKRTLYVVGRGAVYRIATQTRGPQRAGK